MRAMLASFAAYHLWLHWRRPAVYLAEPHLMPPLLQKAVGCEIGKHYPDPIVDPKAAYYSARKRIYEWRRQKTVKEALKAVYDKHGSRRRGIRTRSSS